MKALWVRIMDRMTDNKIVLVTQKTRLESLVYRYNTESQAKFYIESHGGDFSDYQNEHKIYHTAVEKTIRTLQNIGYVQVIDSTHIPNFLFGTKDLVIAVGRDGLVVNIMKYLDRQMLIGVNPDPKRWSGVLLPFSSDELAAIVPEVFKNKRNIKTVTIACASLNDGQKICGVNDIFIGQRTHMSARYEISLNDRCECQSSSGIIISTGLGSTGWLKGIIAGAAGIDRGCGINQKPFVDTSFGWDSDYLYFTVREPYPSNSTGAGIVFGKIENGKKLRIVSNMPENGVIFSDGVEQDFLQFNSGTIAEIGISEKHGYLVV